jgi:uncharacterized protein (TIGR02246 family)
MDAKPMTNMKTMTKIVRACSVLSLLLGNVLAQQPAAPSEPRTCTDQAALDQIAAQWKSAYNQGDAARVAALYTDDAYYLTQHFVTGIVNGRAAIQAYVQNGVDAHYRVDSIDVVAMECFGDIAYTVTRYQSTNGGKKASGVNLVVLRRLAGSWKIVAHEAAVPDPATAIQRLNAPNVD